MLQSHLLGWSSEQFYFIDHAKVYNKILTQKVQMNMSNYSHILW